MGGPSEATRKTSVFETVGGGEVRTREGLGKRNLQKGVKGPVVGWWWWVAVGR